SFQNFYISANSNLIDSAKKFLNVPYLWGGKSSMGIDCSGFSQIIFKSHGIQLKRDAFQQAQQGEVVDFLSVSSPGDLAFFDNNEGKITHVGILLNNAEIIHASGQVKIEKIDNCGIINNETNQYSHKLRMIRRILK
ncbi:MAG: C40 family peptidase, partial [Bacteroidetes bacterium]|nr:C40 family peptidase [Bacteroidota bacterium]